MVFARNGSLHAPQPSNLSQATPSHLDPTVCDPDLRAKIETSMGVSLRADSEAVRLIVQRSKEAGNEAMKSRRYKGKPHTAAYIVFRYMHIMIIFKLPTF
jgi:hypothetical protein